MDPQSIRRWCLLNIILPGLSLIDDNSTTPPPTCHLPAAPGPGSTEFWTNSFWGGLIITLVVVITVGTVLAIYLHRRRTMLRGMLERGLISKEEFQRLK